MALVNEDLETLVVAYILKHYPDLTRAARTALYRATPALQHGYAALKAATEHGDRQTATRQTYLAWVDALKTLQEPRSPTGGEKTRPQAPIAPAGTEDLPVVHHSVVLETDFLVCKDATTARRYWEHPEQGVAYTLAELRLLKQVREADADQFPTTMAWIHDIKSHFGGFVEKFLDKDAKNVYPLTKENMTQMLMQPDDLPQETS